MSSYSPTSRPFASRPASGWSWLANASSSGSSSSARHRAGSTQTRTQLNGLQELQAKTRLARLKLADEQAGPLGGEGESLQPALDALAAELALSRARRRSWRQNGRPAWPATRLSRESGIGRAACCASSAPCASYHS